MWRRGFHDGGFQAAVQPLDTNHFVILDHLSIAFRIRTVLHKAICRRKGIAFPDDMHRWFTTINLDAVRTSGYGSRAVANRGIALNALDRYFNEYRELFEAHLKSILHSLGMTEDTFHELCGYLQDMALVLGM